ncbi:MAG: B3/B4 domain-containing protein [Candidatus Thorarchaeota archaeon]|jgi:DNA/RNA-binding domain of Phe-tRNA-synthetase-like protein
MKLPEISFEVEHAGLKIGLIGLDALSVEPSKDEWQEYEASVFEKIRSSISLDIVKDDFLFRSYRDMYWKYGMDPTKTRVSSEAVLRRIVNGLNLWRVSNLVDVINLASAYHKIPIGLVDAAKVKGNLRIRVAKKGEIFVRIGGAEKECRGREIVLSDSEKIICFGYATHDSDSTRITNDTKQAHVILYGAPEVTSEYLESAVRDTLQMIVEWVDCKVAGEMYFSSSTN